MVAVRPFAIALSESEKMAGAIPLSAGSSGKSHGMSGRSTTMGPPSTWPEELASADAIVNPPMAAPAAAAPLTRILLNRFIADAPFTQLSSRQHFAYQVPAFLAAHTDRVLA
jgi:hypothetical protein